MSMVPDAARVRVLPLLRLVELDADMQGMCEPGEAS